MKVRFCLLVAAVSLAISVPAFATQKLTGPLAKHYIGKAMKSEFGGAWQSGQGKNIRDCKRMSRVRMRCRVTWGVGDIGYDGRVTVWFRNQYYLYRYQLKKTDYYCIDSGGSDCVDVVRGP